MRKGKSVPASRVSDDALWRVVLALIVLAGLSWVSYREPITPDADDCEAQGKPADCWKDR